ncbi:MAG TPA: hypothetical protein DCZ91_20450 [Lachnospiraceae bacterium]|nr:hypothetical protein [Lachnospiraceae bacterium]
MGLLSNDERKDCATVSVIIPVYNTENYLEECIGSVVGQDYTNLEIILINDGSTDRSGFICKKWKAIDSRIKYVEKENEGQGIARNLGIRMATGKYLIFVDSDDYIEHNLVSQVYSRITEEKADICVYASCGIGDKGNGGGLEFKLAKGTYVEANRELLGQMIPILCNKMFSVGLLRRTGVSMNNRMCEDLVFNARIYMEAEKICFLDMSLYNYRYLREGNFSTNYGRYYEVEESIQELNELFLREDRFDKYWQQLYEISFNMFKTILFRIRVWKEYDVPPEMKNRYPEFFRSYKRFLSRWFRQYLTMELQEKNFLLVGSYSLRVTVHAMLLNEEYLRSDYASSSIVSLMSNPCYGIEKPTLKGRKSEAGNCGNVSVHARIIADRLDALLESARWKNPYRKRCVEQDIRKHFKFHAVLEEKDYVAVDLLEEIFDLVEIGDGCYITESEFLREAGLKSLEGCVRIPFLSAARRELFRRYVPLFAKKLKQADVRVIVVKNFLCEKHGEYYDRLTEYDSTEYSSGRLYSLEKIRETNRELEWCYGYLLQCLPDAIVVDALEFQELEFTHDAFPFGREPVYYNSGYYQRMAIRINQGIRSILESAWLSELKSNIEVYDRIFLVREDEQEAEKLLDAFLKSRALRKTKFKVLVLSAMTYKNWGQELMQKMPSLAIGENGIGTGGMAEYKQITEENARFLLSLYHMYEFSDRFRLISTREICGSLFQLADTGLLSREEVWEAMLD